MVFGRSIRTDDVSWNRLLEANSVDISLFFENVDYLCRKRYKSRAKGLKELKLRVGYSMQERSIKYYKVGAWRDCPMSKLRAFSLLFGEPVHELMSVDYRLRDEAAGVKPVK